jgi:hypothetical protein
MIRFRILIPIVTLLLLVFETLLIIASFVVACFLMLQMDPRVYLLDDGGLLSIFLVLVSILAGLYFQGLYSDPFLKSWIGLLHQLCVAIGIAFITQGLVSYLFHSLRTPAHVMVVGSFLSFVTIFAWRVSFCAVVLPLLRGEQLMLACIHRSPFRGSSSNS